MTIGRNVTPGTDADPARCRDRSPPTLKNVAMRHALAIVGVEVVPVAPGRIAERAGPLAARRAIVERTRVPREARPGAPVVREDPVRVDVAAQIQPVAAVVPRPPLIEVPAEAAQVLRRRVVAELHPVAHRPHVGAAHEPDVVDVEARALEAGVEVEADLRPARSSGGRSCRRCPRATSASGPPRRDPRRGAGSCGRCFPAAAGSRCVSPRTELPTM